MTTLEALGLLAAALCGGALNSVAGGGSFFTFPVLLWAGLGPVAANVTSAVALWPGSVASTWAYRRELRKESKGLWALSLASLVGGGLGAAFLLRTSDATFAKLIPWLLLGATVLFAASNRLVPRLQRLIGPRAPWPGWLPLLQGLIALYGGYFGGGMGILMLAAYALCGMTDLHAMNARKSLQGAVTNGIAIIAFVAAGKVNWQAGLLMTSGAIAGGWGGAVLARRVDGRRVRPLVVAVGALLTLWFFWRSLQVHE